VLCNKIVFVATGSITDFACSCIHSIHLLWSKAPFLNAPHALHVALPGPGKIPAFGTGANVFFLKQQ